MSKKLPPIWDADDHTIAKITILRQYLVPYFKILGAAFPGRELLYVDGFAGPGEYRNYPTGSPLAALSAAVQARSELGSRWKAGQIHLALIEEDDNRFENLERVVARYQDDARIEIHLYHARFTDGIADLRVKLPGPFEGATPLFVFIDPFGPTNGSPMSTVMEILRSPSSEVLINLDADGIARMRFAREKIAGNALSLDDIFGDRSWEARLSPTKSEQALARDVLDLYKDQLARNEKVRFIFPFEMRSKDDTLNYYLLFASQEKLGLEKMKEAMKRVDQDGSFCFSDARVGQEVAFRQDDPETFANRMHRKFLGEVRSYSELEEYVLLQTPFANPKRLLRILEDDKRVVVSPPVPPRQKHSYKADEVVSVEFVQPPYIAASPLTLFDT